MKTDGRCVDCNQLLGHRGCTTYTCGACVLKSEVEAMLKQAEAEMSAEVLAGNIVKEALWKGEVTAFKCVLKVMREG